MRKLLKPMFMLTVLMTVLTGCSKPQQAGSDSSGGSQGGSEKPADASKSTESAKPATVKENKDIKIGISLPTQREERWTRDKKTFEDYAKELGIQVVVQISDADMAVQAQQFRSLMSQGVDAIILAPHDGGSAGTLVEEAASEGVPVLSYDRLILNTDKLALYVSFDNQRVGELQGDYITKLVPQGNYIVMGGAPTDNNAKLFKAGAMSKIQPLVDSGAIKIVADQDVENWLPDNAKKIVEQALTVANNDVQAILAPNDGTAGGAIAAMQQAGVTGIPITGQDAEFSGLKRIKEGAQSMTIYKDAVKEARMALDAALLLAKKQPIANTNGKVANGKFDVPSILMDPTVVDKNNLAQLATDLKNYGVIDDAQFSELQ